MIWEGGQEGKDSLAQSQGGLPPLLMLLTCTQAMPTPTAPMIFRWSRMNSSSLLMQPPWKNSTAFVVSVDVGVRLRPHCKQALVSSNTRVVHHTHAGRPAQVLHCG